MTADTQGPRWGACLHGFKTVQALVCFSFCSHALSTHNMAGNALISSVALTDFTFLTACEIGTIIIPLSLMLKLRLRDLKEFARVITASTRRSRDPSLSTWSQTMFCKMHFLVPHPASSRRAFLSLVFCFHLPIKYAVTLSHVYKSIAISCISLLMLKDS